MKDWKFGSNAIFLLGVLLCIIVQEYLKSIKLHEILTIRVANLLYYRRLLRRAIYEQLLNLFKDVPFNYLNNVAGNKLIINFKET